MSTDTPIVAHLTAAELERYKTALAQLAALRAKAPRLLIFLEEALAAQGDHADRELISLQHWLVEQQRLPANTGSSDRAQLSLRPL